MQLTVLERLLALDVLPAQGSLTTLKIVQDARVALSFDEAEHAALKFSEDNGMIRWDVNAETVKDIKLGPKVQEIIRERLDELSRAEKLRLDHLSLCDKFSIAEE